MVYWGTLKWQVRAVLRWDMHWILLCRISWLCVYYSGLFRKTKPLKYVNMRVHLLGESATTIIEAERSQEKPLWSGKPEKLVAWLSTSERGLRIKEGDNVPPSPGLRAWKSFGGLSWCKSQTPTHEKPGVMMSKSKRKSKFKFPYLHIFGFPCGP